MVVPRGTDSLLIPSDARRQYAHQIAQHAMPSTTFDPSSKRLEYRVPQRPAPS